MPQYQFQHTKTREQRLVFFRMNDEKIYNGEDGKEVGLWKRILIKPDISVDTHVDPYSAKDFAKVTNKQHGVLGDMLDRSEELSQKRADKEGGVDPIRAQFYDRYSKKHKGRKHPQQTREEGVRKLKDIGVNLEWGD